MKFPDLPRLHAWFGMSFGAQHPLRIISRVTFFFPSNETMNTTKKLVVWKGLRRLLYPFHLVTRSEAHVLCFFFFDDAPIHSYPTFQGATFHVHSWFQNPPNSECQPWHPPWPISYQLLTWALRSWVWKMGVIHGPKKHAPKIIKGRRIRHLRPCSYAELMNHSHCFTIQECHCIYHCYFISTMLWYFDTIYAIMFYIDEWQL